MSRFPSPCGVWVVSGKKYFKLLDVLEFPSPCGVWVVSVRALPPPRAIRGFRPLAGCGLFLQSSSPKPDVFVSVPLRGVGCFRSPMWRSCSSKCFRPLAGCGLFPGYRDGSAALLVSVPLRGVGCFPFVSKIMSAGLFPSPCGVWVVSSKRMPKRMKATEVSVPLRGVGCFGMDFTGVEIDPEVSVPLRGVGCFLYYVYYYHCFGTFPSSCGVWVVSAKLHILSGATGKRIVNSAILLYHIGRCLSIAN